jgi:chromosome segregation ATPase
MNLVGKIFTVLVFILAVAFMTLAMMVYATHKNYRKIVDNAQASSEYPLGLNQQLQREQDLNKLLNDEKANVERNLATEWEAKIGALTKLENEIVDLRKDILQREQEKAKLTEELRRAVADMDVAKKMATDLDKEVNENRAALETAQKDRRLHEKEVERLTDNAHQLKNDLRLLKDRHTTLTTDLAK